MPELKITCEFQEGESVRTIVARGNLLPMSGALVAFDKVPAYAAQILAKALAGEIAALSRVAELELALAEAKAPKTKKAEGDGVLAAGSLLAEQAKAALLPDPSAGRVSKRRE
jgi:hypothetical protein